MGERILVVDDEPHLAGLVVRALSIAGYEVESALTGERGLELARNEAYDLVLLDLRLADLDGIDVLRGILAVRPEQRVLVFSGFSDAAVRARCLELGASDFLTKPFTLPELQARVEARLRQLPGQAKAPRFLEAGTLTVDLVARSAIVDGHPVSLSQREFLLLEHLARNAGEVCSREELLGEVWGYTFDPGTNVVDVYIARLRAKLGGGLIETVRGVGYALRHA